MTNQQEEQASEVIEASQVFQEIVCHLWQKQGGGKADSLVIESYNSQLKDAVEDLFKVEITSNQAVLLWRQMQGKGLARSEKGEQGYELTLLNPHQRNWNISKQPAYRWYKNRPEEVAEKEKEEVEPVMEVEAESLEEVAQKVKEKVSQQTEQLSLDLQNLLQKRAQKSQEIMQTDKEILSLVEALQSSYQAAFQSVEVVQNLWQKLLQMEKEEQKFLQEEVEADALEEE